MMKTNPNQSSITLWQMGNRYRDYKLCKIRFAIVASSPYSQQYASAKNETTNIDINHTRTFEL